jgi:hypothetical protein
MRSCHAVTSKRADVANRVFAKLELNWMVARPHDRRAGNMMIIRTHEHRTPEDRHAKRRRGRTLSGD